MAEKTTFAIRWPLPPLPRSNVLAHRLLSALMLALALWPTIHGLLNPHELHVWLIIASIPLAISVIYFRKVRDEIRYRNVYENFAAFDPDMPTGGRRQIQALLAKLPCPDAIDVAISASAVMLCLIACGVTCFLIMQSDEPSYGTLSWPIPFLLLAVRRFASDFSRKPLFVDEFLKVLLPEDDPADYDFTVSIDHDNTD